MDAGPCRNFSVFRGGHGVAQHSRAPTSWPSGNSTDCIWVIAPYLPVRPSPLIGLVCHSGSPLSSATPTVISGRGRRRPCSPDSARNCGCSAKPGCGSWCCLRPIPRCSGSRPRTSPAQSCGTGWQPGSWSSARTFNSAAAVRAASPRSANWWQPQVWMVSKSEPSKSRACRSPPAESVPRLAAGDIDHANELLGRAYEVPGRVDVADRVSASVLISPWRAVPAPGSYTATIRPGRQRSGPVLHGRLEVHRDDAGSRHLIARWTDTEMRGPPRPGPVLVTFGAEA